MKWVSQPQAGPPAPSGAVVWSRQAQAVPQLLIFSLLVERTAHRDHWLLRSVEANVALVECFCGVVVAIPGQKTVRRQRS